jgi:repressor LexA
LAEQNIQEYFPLPKDFSRSEEVFMLKVRGDSMINAGIFDGDMVIVNKEPVAKNGDIVVALLGDEATVKRFYKETTRVRLQPENEKYEPILSPDVQILGKVVGLIRRIN